MPGGNGFQETIVLGGALPVQHRQLINLFSTTYVVPRPDNRASPISAACAAAPFWSLVA
jgi:hypothetical protein